MTALPKKMEEAGWAGSDGGQVRYYQARSDRRYLRAWKINSIPILDLPISDPPPEVAEWIDAYRRWYGN